MLYASGEIAQIGRGGSLKISGIFWVIEVTVTMMEGGELAHDRGLNHSMDIFLCHVNINFVYVTEL